MQATTVQQPARPRSRTGKGMPPPRDYRDHPEYYAEGDFPADLEVLRRRLPDFARLVVGDIRDTVPACAAQLSPAAPIGYVAIDVDHYWSTVECMALFTAPPTCYLLPADHAGLPR